MRHGPYRVNPGSPIKISGSPNQDFETGGLGDRTYGRYSTPLDDGGPARFGSAVPISDA